MPPAEPTPTHDRIREIAKGLAQMDFDEEAVALSFYAAASEQKDARIAELEREVASARQSNQDLVNIHNLIDTVLSDYNEGKLMPEAAIDRVADAVGDAF